MTCIFESNLRNNPMHNRHILREYSEDEIEYINGGLDDSGDEETEYSDDFDGGFDGEPAMESCVFGSNLFGHGGYGNSILREEADCIGIRCARPKNGYCADVEEVDKPEYEKPEVKKTPRLCAKRNRRLRSKTRNIQLWDTKKKRFAPEWGNTRFTRMKDANEAISKMEG